MKQLDKKYANTKEMLAAGFTEADIKALAEGPRTKEADYDEEHTYFKWPYINGISTTGLFSLLNRTEKDAYNAYHKKHGPNGARTGVVSDAKKEVIAKCDALVDYIKTNMPEDKQAAALELVAALRPVVKVGLVKELFDVDDISQLKSKVTRAWIMYRGPNGERGENPAKFKMADALKAWGDDIVLAMSKQQIEEKVKKLEEKGIIVKDTIID